MHGLCIVFFLHFLSKCRIFTTMSIYFVILIGFIDAISDKWIEFALNVLARSIIAYVVASARSQL
jgi:hypothetical protein